VGDLNYSVVPPSDINHQFLAEIWWLFTTHVQDLNPRGFKSALRKRVA
jgi:hypothetical protein